MTEEDMEKLVMEIQELNNKIVNLQNRNRELEKSGKNERNQGVGEIGRKFLN